MKRNVLIAQGGGPTAVINSSLYGVLREAENYSQIGHVYGAVHGIEGVLKEELMDLSMQDPAQIELLPQTPSAALGSCRRKLSDEDYPRLLEVFRKYNIGWFFYNGGNDSMDTCAKVEKMAKEFGYDLVSIGIPKTIDNDLDLTDHCPGYGSAARFVANNVRDLWMEVQAMPNYVTIVEAMGRNAGWLTAAAALPLYNGKPCCQMIYLPERTFDTDAFLADVDDLLHRQKEILIVVSEGVKDSSGEMLSTQSGTDSFGHKTAGGSSEVLSALVTEKLGVRSRAERYGLLGRTSSITQSAQDRDEAIAVGRHAMKLAMSGVSGVMAAIQRDSTDPYIWSLSQAPLEKVANLEKMFPDAWIAEKGNFITEDFRRYCLPLIGEPFPPFAVLDRIVPQPVVD